MLTAEDYYKHYCTPEILRKGIIYKLIEIEPTDKDITGTIITHEAITGKVIEQQNFKYSTCVKIEVLIKESIQNHNE